ncbi:MAG: HAD family hydrolase [Candidatus Poribacteria bacterium]|nr:HAD family hydrolase [Candidatus Poribacteria bacterium]MDE0505122.1 HAD family hydrolase [Candidatus Poribacteria bacterium]
MTRIQAILFDFGGTLDGNGLHWRERACRFIQSKFPHVSREEFVQADRASVAKFVASGDGPRCSLRQTAGAIFTGIYEGLELNPRIRDVFLDDFCRDAEQWLHQNRQWLESLRTDYQLGVISNNFGNTKGWCDDYSLSPLLDVIVDSTVVGIKKPDGGIFRTAMTELGVSADEAIYVGDTYLDDMVGAKSVGMWTAWLVGDQPDTCQESPAADFRLSMLKDLNRFLPNHDG